MQLDPMKLNVQAMAKTQSQSASESLLLNFTICCIRSLLMLSKNISNQEKKLFLKKKSRKLEKLTEIAGSEPYKAEGRFLYTLLFAKILLSCKDPNGNIVKDCTRFCLLSPRSASCSCSSWYSIWHEKLFFFLGFLCTSNENLENACVRIKNACARLS